MITTGPDIDSLIAAFDERHTQMSGDYGVFCRLDDARWPCPDRLLIDALTAETRCDFDCYMCENGKRFVALERNPR